MRLHTAVVVLLAVCCLDVAVCAGDADDVVPDDSEGPALKALLLAVNGANIAESAAALLFKTFDGSSRRLFEHYNRFKDVSKKTGEQALGTQEVRELLKDIGLANFALRGQLATAAISVCDSDGDGKVSERELTLLIDLARCWLGSSVEAQAAVQRISSLASRTANFYDWHSAPLLLEELRSCVGLRPFVASWSRRLHKMATKGLPTALREPEIKCIKSLLPKLQGGHTAIRKQLKSQGVKLLLARVLLASGILEYADGDRDGELDEMEVMALVSPLCDVAALFREKRASPIAIAEGFLLGSPYELADFLKALEKAPAMHQKAAAALSVRERLHADDLGALAVAYLSMAPPSAFREEGALRAKPHDEL